VENYKEQGSPQMAIWHTHIARWMPKATYTHKHTHTPYVILLAFPLQQWLFKCTSMVHYAYIAYLVELTIAFISFIFLIMSGKGDECDQGWNEKQNDVSVKESGGT
jgi:hypothetical protein